MRSDDNKQAAFGSEYTIITNRDYDDQHPLDLEANFEELTNYLPEDFKFGKKPGDTDHKTGQKKDQETDPKKEMDDLYEQYIAVHRGEIGFLDEEDLFPRSYHWKLEDKYAPDKKEILEEAVRFRKKIEETQAYQDYVEKKKRQKTMDMSWDD